MNKIHDAKFFPLFFVSFFYFSIYQSVVLKFL